MLGMKPRALGMLVKHPQPAYLETGSFNGRIRSLIAGIGKSILW